MLTSFWQPPPSYTLFDTKTFKAGLAIHGRDVVDGDMVFHVHVADHGKAFQDLASELRLRSQQEKKSVFWAVSLNDAIDRETVEGFRSKEMLTRKEREAKTADETTLIGEEKVRRFSARGPAATPTALCQFTSSYSRRVPFHLGGGGASCAPRRSRVAQSRIVLPSTEADHGFGQQQPVLNGARAWLDKVGSPRVTLGTICESLVPFARILEALRAVGLTLRGNHEPGSR